MAGARSGVSPRSAPLHRSAAAHHPGPTVVHRLRQREARHHLRRPALHGPALRSAAEALPPRGRRGRSGRRGGGGGVHRWQWRRRPVARRGSRPRTDRAWRPAGRGHGRQWQRPHQRARRRRQRTDPPRCGEARQCLPDRPRERGPGRSPAGSRHRHSPRHARHVGNRAQRDVRQGRRPVSAALVAGPRAGRRRRAGRRCGPDGIRRRPSARERSCRRLRGADRAGAGAPSPHAAEGACHRADNGGGRLCGQVPGGRRARRSSGVPGAGRRSAIASRRE